MNTYRRYFAIKDAATIETIEAIMDEKIAYGKAINEIGKEVGAKQAWQTTEGSFYGFDFEETPDRSLWKQTRHKDAWKPKLSSRAGKALSKRIGDIPKPRMAEDALEPHGLRGGFSGGMFVGTKVLLVTIAGSSEKGWFVSLPWQDRNPAEIEQYKKDREQKKQFDSTLDHLCWTPPAEWEEVKEWQVLKALDNEAA